MGMTKVVESKMKVDIEKGCLIWNDSDLDSNDFILILPDDAYYTNNKIRSAFNIKLGERRGIIIEGEQAKQLLNLYSLYAFTNKLIIGSFDLPHGRKLRNLLEVGIATEDELINDVILGVM